MQRRLAWAVVFLALAALLWYTAEVFLLAFAGILLAVFLDFVAGVVSSHTGLGHRGSFAVTVLSIGGLLVLAAWIAVPRVADQVSRLVHMLPEGLERLRYYLEHREWGRTLLPYLPRMVASADLTGKLTALMARLFDGLAALVVAGVTGLYFGANPGLYRRGVLSLFGEEQRERAGRVLQEVGYTLRWWATGQLVPMAVLGIATTIGLELLGVHLAFTLGLFTGFMIFIPYIGSLIALVVTALVALMQGSSLALYVVILFLAVHIAEGYLLTPLVQKRAVYLPPALTILSQLFMGLLLGFEGLALATPLTAAALVMVKMLYLHETPEHHG
jgi:predicted PurR-regulated permease PerM